MPLTCTGGQITTSGTLTVTATSDGGVTTSNSQDYIIDTGDPTVTINQKVGQPDPTNINSAIYTIVFSEPMNTSSLTAGDITLTGTTTGTATSLTNIDNRTWEVTVTGLTDGDTVTATIDAGKATDLAGNANLASTSTDNSITYDGSRPSVTVNQATTQADPTNTDSATFTIVFSEAINPVSFTASDITLTGTTGTVTSLTTTDNITYTATVTGMTSGDTVKMSLTADVATDLANNTDTASTSTDNSVHFDNTPPTAAVANLTTSDTTPVIEGTTNDPEATITVTIDGNNYTAVNNGDGTWTLPDNTVSPALADGSYDITITATDPAGNQTTETVTDALTIDTIAPTGTLNDIPAGIDNSPELSGTIDDPEATVTVTIDGNTYTAVNNGDGTWTLPQGTIQPGLIVDTYTAKVIFEDAAGNNSEVEKSFTVQRPDADLPTVNAATWIGGNPVITGTYDAENSQSLRIRLNGMWYTLGVDSELTATDNTWRLDLTSLDPPLEADTYNIVVQVTTRDGSVLSDTTASELTVLAPTVENIVTNPGATVNLANTGMPVWTLMLLGAAVMAGGAVCMRRRYGR